MERMFRLVPRKNIVGNSTLNSSSGLTGGPLLIALSAKYFSSDLGIRWQQ